MLRSIGKNILQYELGSKVSIDPYRQLTLVSRPSAYKPICFKNTNSWLKNHLNFFFQFCAHVNDEKGFLGKTVEKHIFTHTPLFCVKLDKNKGQMKTVMVVKLVANSEMTWVRKQPTYD